MNKIFFLMNKILKHTFKSVLPPNLSEKFVYFTFLGYNYVSTWASEILFL